MRLHDVISFPSYCRSKKNVRSLFFNFHRFAEFLSRKHHTTIRSRVWRYRHTQISLIQFHERNNNNNNIVRAPVVAATAAAGASVSITRDDGGGNGDGGVGSAKTRALPSPDENRFRTSGRVLRA